MILTETIKLLEDRLGKQSISTDSETIRNVIENSYGLSRNIIGIVYPQDLSEVEFIVNTANRHKIPLYPISRGQNIGYGDKLPPGDMQLIVDMHRMNRISNFNPQLGKITLEPGVTQSQLYNFLISESADFWMDTTGAGLDSSYVGNALAGGFGHTPKGNRRNEISNLTVVCGNGTVLNTGDRLDYGPDITGLFVQSNFGIVTSLQTQLMRKPDDYKSFIIKISKESSLEALIDNLRKLRQSGTLTSLVHIANPIRAIMSTSKAPDAYINKAVTPEDAISLMSSTILKVGYWTVIGGLYGSKKEISLKQKSVYKEFKRIGKCDFFSVKKINILKYLKHLDAKIGHSLDSLSYTHELGMGKPNDKQLQNISWRTDKKEKMGLIWYSPSVAAQGTELRKVVDTASMLYQKYDFEFPITITLVSPERATSVMSINYDKTDEVEKERAFNLYKALKSEFEKIGIFPYRYGILDMRDVRYIDQGKNQTLKMLKKIFDPNNIIAPMMYGM